MLGVRDTHRHDIRARRGLDHGQRVFAFADGTEERLLAVEPRNTCRHRSWAPRAGRTLGGATLTFSDAAGLGREPYRRQHRGAHARGIGESREAAMRTNDLVKAILRKAILKIVELRGTRTPDLLVAKAPPAVGAVVRSRPGCCKTMHSEPGRLRSGAHRGHTGCPLPCHGQTLCVLTGIQARESDVDVR